jgi:hypothetical protein
MPVQGEPGMGEHRHYRCGRRAGLALVVRVSAFMGRPT